MASFTSPLARTSNSDFDAPLARGFRHPRVVPFGTAPAASASEDAKVGDNTLTALADVGVKVVNNAANLGGVAANWSGLRGAAT